MQSLWARTWQPFASRMISAALGRSLASTFIALTLFHSEAVGSPTLLLIDQLEVAEAAALRCPGIRTPMMMAW